MPDLTQAIFIATKNAGKLREFRSLFDGSPFRVETFAEYEDVAEGERSYAENAALKTVALRRQLSAVGRSEHVLGDDSGIEVRALGGRPGVLSARYGGESATWADRRALLRSELAMSASTDRHARFVCALSFLSGTGRAIAVESFVDGEISAGDAGEGGFSYDAAFWYPPAGKTFGELDEAVKNLVSARARAVTSLLEALRANLPAPHGTALLSREEVLPRHGREG